MLLKYYLWPNEKNAYRTSTVPEYDDCLEKKQLFELNQCWCLFPKTLFLLDKMTARQTTVIQAKIVGRHCLKNEQRAYYLQENR